MDKDTKFGLLVMGVPLLGLLYVAFVIAVMLFSPFAQEHPISMAAVFVIAPSLISGSIWLIGSAKSPNKKRLGL
jgi:uncharacterized membrane protein